MRFQSFVINASGAWAGSFLAVFVRVGVVARFFTQSLLMWFNVPSALTSQFEKSHRSHFCVRQPSRSIHLPFGHVLVGFSENTRCQELFIVSTSHARHLIRRVQRCHLVTFRKGGIVEYRVEKVIEASIERQDCLADMNQFGRARADGVNTQ